MINILCVTFNNKVLLAKIGHPQDISGVLDLMPNYFDLWNNYLLPWTNSYVFHLSYYKTIIWMIDGLGGNIKM